jgi:hypothetical protein
MGAIPGQNPVLRLVRPDGDVPGRSVLTMRGEPGAAGRVDSGRVPGRGAIAGRDGAVRLERAEERVARENASAASLPALDARWIMAVQVMREMQGGRAAVVTPESRKRLMLVGRRLGLRAFDSSLVIAIVQDGARRGEDPLGGEATARLRLVGGAEEPELADARPGLSWGQAAVLVIAAGVFGAAIAVWMMRMLGAG